MFRGMLLLSQTPRLTSLDAALSRCAGQPEHRKPSPAPSRVPPSRRYLVPSPGRAVSAASARRWAALFGAAPVHPRSPAARSVVGAGGTRLSGSWAAPAPTALSSPSVRKILAGGAPRSAADGAPSPAGSAGALEKRAAGRFAACTAGHWRQSGRSVGRGHALRSGARRPAPGARAQRGWAAAPAPRACRWKGRSRRGSRASG